MPPASCVWLFVGAEYQSRNYKHAVYIYVFEQMLAFGQRCTIPSNLLSRLARDAFTAKLGNPASGNLGRLGKLANGGKLPTCRYTAVLLV